MDNPVYTDITIFPVSPPPSYLEASACPPHTEAPRTPPPAYTPGSFPPSYNETMPVPVVVVQPTAALADHPTATVCPHCHCQVTTSITHKPGMSAWSTCLLLTLLGLICGFCLIPFMINKCKDVHHSCPECHRHIGIFVRT
ncbi:hypothetical protein ACEWY4_008794 [Coilia grayii]|uniref:LITAF domain-containing protein n=1 Tax=Coilia grayii TaxID=363190 RepID=A0ABD1KCB1_9TELE